MYQYDAQMQLFCDYTEKEDKTFNSKLLLEKQVNVIELNNAILFWLSEAKSKDINYDLNLEKIKNFFNNIDYSYWDGKENCVCYFNFCEFLKL